jgi:transcriptional regulator with XRE-family HTH domain
MTAPHFSHTPSLMAIGAQLRALRVAAKKTQTALAAEIDVDQSLISNVERGTRATTTDVLERWVQVCNSAIVFADADDPLVGARALPPPDLGLLARLASALGDARDDPYRKAVIMGAIEGAIEGVATVERKVERQHRSPL